MEKETKTLIGQATEEQIAEWKKQYGDIWAATCDGHVAYLKRPSRKALSYASVASNNGKDQIKFVETIFDDCFIGGSQEFKKNDAFFMGVSKVLIELVDIKNVELGKL